MIGTTSEVGGSFPNFALIYKAGYMMKRLMYLVHIIDSINSWVGKVFSFAVILITAIMMLEVILRYVFNRPTIWAGEVVLYLFIALVLTGGYALLHEGHVRMDVLYGRFSNKGKAISDIATFVVFLLFISLLLWKGTEMAWESIKMREVSWTYFAPPLYPVKACLPVAFFLILLQGVAKFIRDIAVIKGDVPQRDGQ